MCGFYCPDDLMSLNALKTIKKKHAVIVLCRLLWLYLQREYKQLIITKLRLNTNLRIQIECVTICVTIMGTE